MAQTLKPERLKSFIRDIPDFPKKGILFKDITPLLKDADAFHSAVTLLGDQFAGRSPEYVVGIESRGFIFASAVAYKLGAGFIPVRKKGKLPFEKASVSYQLEYGEDTLEIHRDSIQPGGRILLVDDLLATGGTASAVCQLVDKMRGEVVGIGFLVELTFLGGRQKLQGYDVHSLIAF